MPDELLEWYGEAFVKNRVRMWLRVTFEEYLQKPLYYLSIVEHMKQGRS